MVELTLSYLSNCNISKFTNVFLYREVFGQSYAYDEDKNLTSVSNLSGQKSGIKYDAADNITSYTQPGRDASVNANQYLFYYGDTTAQKKQHLLWRLRTPMHMTDFYSYDAYGNVTSSRRLDYRVDTNDTAEEAYPYIRTENTYTADGNYAATTKDARGNVVTSDVNTVDGTLSSVQDPAGQTVSYTYDAAKRVTDVQTVADGNAYKNAYTYANDRIETVSHNTTGDTPDVTYTFQYDELGRKTSVKVGTQVLSTNVYANDRNGLLSEVTYGNGGKVSYSYDEFNRLTGIRHDEATEDRYTYEYGANGQAAKVTDRELGRELRTSHDLADRPCQMELIETETGEVLYKTLLKYDKLNNLVQFAEKAGSEAHTSEYTYDRDNRVTEIGYDGSVQKVKYSYDALGRIATREVENGTTAGKLTSTYSYVAGGYGANSTTPLVAAIAQAQIPFEYSYDNRGNIISEKRGELTTTYAYDALGQLIRVNDPHENATWVYECDRGGNILSKVRYAYTTGDVGAAQETIPYVYGDANWKDKLTSFNGQTITYDAIGNPLNDGIWEYTWQKGRQLKKIEREDTIVSFKYNHSGLHVEKKVQQDWYPETTKYTLNGKLIAHMTVDYHDWNEIARQDVLHFFYDAQSRPAKVEFNGTMYTYVHNLQGDIVGIVDSAGTLVVEYKYDAWGKPLNTTGSMAETLGERNPFRYRGYVYDEETGLYYLRSRYYNPDLCRFSNLDDIGYISFDNSLYNGNLFISCRNNPTGYSDHTGHFGLISFLGAVVGGAIGGAVISAVSCLVDSALSDQELTGQGLANAIVTGALSGAVGAAIGTISCVTVAATVIYKGVASMAVGIGMGVKTYIETGDGVSEDQRIRTAHHIGVVTIGATFTGSLMPVYDESFGFAGNIFTNYAGTLFIGTPAEMISVAGKQYTTNPSRSDAVVGTRIIDSTGRTKPIDRSMARTLAMVA